MWMQFRYVNFYLKEPSGKTSKSSMMLLQCSKSARTLIYVYIFDGEILKQRTMASRKGGRKIKLFQTTSIPCIPYPLRMGIFTSLLLSFHQIILVFWSIINIRKHFWTKPSDRSHLEVLKTLHWRVGWAEQGGSSLLPTFFGTQPGKQIV